MPLCTVTASINNSMSSFDGSRKDHCLIFCGCSHCLKFSSVFWHYCCGIRKGLWPVKSLLQLFPLVYLGDWPNSTTESQLITSLMRVSSTDWLTDWLALLVYSVFYLPSVLWRCWLGDRKGIRPVKKWVVGWWRGCVSGSRYRFTYGPADATAAHCLLLL